MSTFDKVKAIVVEQLGVDSISKSLMMLLKKSKL